MGNSHIVTEHLGKNWGHRADDLHIDFVSPTTYGLSTAAMKAAGVRFVVTARPQVANDEGGKGPLGHAAVGHMIHIARDLPASQGKGIELRSRIWTKWLLLK